VMEGWRMWRGKRNELMRERIGRRAVMIVRAGGMGRESWAVWMCW
jgi:hypothetical protein